MARQCTTAQYFTLPAPTTALQITGNMTFLCYLLGTGTIGNLIACYNGSSPFQGWGLATGNNVSGALEYWNGSAWNSATTVISNGAWHSAGITLSGTTLAHWRDGATNGTQTITAPAAWTGIKAIGANIGGASILGYTLAEMAAWNVALSPAQVLSYHNGTLPSSILPGNLVGYWQFLGDSSPEPDTSGSGNHATLVGTPTKVDHPPVFLTPATYAQTAYRWRANDGSLFAP
jgi:hypothetical protein